MGEFFQISSTKDLPLIGAGMVPAAQFVGRREFAQPFVESGALLRETAGPEAVDEHALAVGPRWRFIHAFDRHRHRQGLLYYCKAVWGGPSGVRLWMVFSEENSLIEQGTKNGGRGACTL